MSIINKIGNMEDFSSFIEGGLSDADGNPVVTKAIERLSSEERLRYASGLFRQITYSDNLYFPMSQLQNVAKFLHIWMFLKLKLKLFIYFLIWTMLQS